MHTDTVCANCKLHIMAHDERLLEKNNPFCLPSDDWDHPPPYAPIVHWDLDKPSLPTLPKLIRAVCAGGIPCYMCRASDSAHHVFNTSGHVIGYACAACVQTNVQAATSYGIVVDIAPHKKTKKARRRR